MDNWVKIQSFSRIHQAELRKDILEQNDIKAVIVNEKDSLFLLGEIELYVEAFNEKKAKALIDEFQGFTKINSFIDMKPILLFQKVLKDNGIKTMIRREVNERYTIDNFELYIENDKIEQVVPYLTGEKLIGMKKVLTCTKVRFAKYFVDLLSANSIDSIIIKKKDSDFHLEEIHIYVDEKYVIKAQELFKELKGLTLFKSSTGLSDIEKDEEILFKKSIKALIQKSGTKYQLFVETEKLDKANEVLNAEREWVRIGSFPNLTNALYYKSVLDLEGIPCIVFNDLDSTFLLGDVDLMVDKKYESKATEIINRVKV